MNDDRFERYSFEKLNDNHCENYNSEELSRNFQDYYQTERQTENTGFKSEEKKQRKHGAKVFAVIAGIVAVCLFATSVFMNISTNNRIQFLERALQSSVAEKMSANNLIQQDSGIVLTDISDIVANTMPSVVSITSRSLVQTGGYRDFWDYYFGRRNGQSSTQEVESGIGSGTIVGMNDEELLILTSYHVVEGCSSLYVTFNDDSSVDGYIKSAAEDMDIAVVAVPISDIPEETKNVIKIAKLSTDGVEVGDGIIVIGDALGYGQSVVTGIISATNRELELESGTLSLIQTDAAINSGNSGGCMLNEKGEIVGISEAKITMSSVEGMCYAIPVKENYELIQELLNTTEEYVSEESQDEYKEFSDDYWSFWF